MKKIARGSALAEVTWRDAFRRVRNRIAFVAAAICAAAAPLSSQAVSALGSISDVRVGPLLTTTWSQTGAGGTSGPSCYNYYTPNHYACGCVATAIAQIMYFHRYPTERIYPGETLYASVNQAQLGASNAGSWSVGSDGTGSYTLYSGGASTAFNPAYGGPYDWSSMVASPTSDTSENSRKAIGLLTRDAGLAVFADYNVKSGETSGFTRARASSLILNLHYADAVRTGFDANKLIANLDAGLPVLLALTSHEVVADGYGYHNGKLYIHINYGHGGTNSGWYDPTSTIGTSNMSIADMVANIFPPTRGARHSSVISGRVLDANGSPVANATVTATGATTATTNSNANGTYAFILPAGNYTFTATSGNSSGTLSNCAVEASEQKTRAEFADPYNQGGWDSGVNNSRSGVNVTLGKTATMGEPDEYLQYVESNGSQVIDTRVTPGPTESVTPFVTAMAVYADLDWTNGICMVSSGYNDFHPLKNNDGKIGASFKNTGGSVMSLASGTALNSGRRHVATTVVKNQPFTVNVDGAIATSGGNAGTLGSGRTLYAFASNNGSSAGDNRCMTKLYGLKICINDELVRDYVPAIKDGVAGLYDRQNDEWYHSQSGAELIAGPALSEYPSLPNPVTADYTLMSDVTIDGTLTVNSGSTIYLNGYKLTVKGLDGSGTITDVVPAAANPGELHVAVPSGTTVANSTVAFTGTMKLVVEGGGTFTASKASQTYTGGTEVLAGTLALGTATHPLGDGNATQTVTVGGNGILNLATYKSESTCYYNLVLESGAEVQAGDVVDRNTGRIASITLNGNATVKMAQKTLFGGSAAGKACQLTFNGYTLTLLSLGDGNFGHVHVNDYGTFRLDANSSSTDCPGMYMCVFDLRGAKLEVTERAFLKFGNWAFYATDFVYSGLNKFTGGAVNAVNSVYGRYVAGSNRPPFTMQSGSTLDLSGQSDTWNAGGQASPSTHSAVTGAGLVTFLAASATYTVDIGTRNVALGEKLVQFADGYDPAASVVFNLAATGAAQTPAERDLGLAVASEGGHTYLVVKSLSTPYARWVIDGSNPANSGWKFYNIRTGAEDTSWTHGVTADMEVRIYSYAEHAAVVQQGVSPMSYTLHGTFQIPSDVAAWDLTSCFDSMADGASIDVNGKKLYLNKVNFTGTITDTTNDTDHPGEVHVTVASGSAENTAVALTGNLKLIKKGAGTLTASKANQTYAGGTEVLSGTLALGTATHPLGNGNATQTVTVGENAVFNFNAKCSDSTCSYGFILNTNSVLRMGTVGSRWNRQVFAITLLGDATYDFGTARTLALFGGGSAGETVITLNGHTLKIEAPANGDINTCNVRTVGEGTISYRSGMAGGFYPEGNTNPTADFSSANVEVVGNAWMNLGSLAFIAKDFKYTSSTHKWTGQLGANPPRVTGRYVAGAYRPPFTMASGSTLDLTEVTGTWDNKTNVQDLTTSYADQTTKIGKVSFTGAITVDLSGRTDLRTIAKSETPYVVTWDSQPNATFTLDAATKKNFKIEPDGTGIKIIPCDGLKVFIK